MDSSQVQLILLRLLQKPRDGGARQRSDARVFLATALTVATPPTLPPHAHQFKGNFTACKRACTLTGIFCIATASQGVAGGNFPAPWRGCFRSGETRQNQAAQPPPQKLREPRELRVGFLRGMALRSLRVKMTSVLFACQ